MYNNTPYIPTWRVRFLHLAGKLVGIRFHIHGFPYGSGSGKYDLPSECGPDYGSGAVPVNPVICSSEGLGESRASGELHHHQAIV